MKQAIQYRGSDEAAVLVFREVSTDKTGFEQSDEKFDVSSEESVDEQAVLGQPVPVVPLLDVDKLF